MRAAISEALERGVIGFDAVKHLVLCRIEKRPPRLNLLASVGFITAAALVHELIEARDEKRLLRFQKQLAKYKLLIIDELGFVPLSVRPGTL